MKTFIYLLIGIKNDGSDDIVNITALSREEAEIIIESFHDGDYRFVTSKVFELPKEFNWEQFE